MNRSRVKNIYVKKSDENKVKYKKQRNFYVNLIKWEKKKSYENLNKKRCNM